MSEPVEHNTIGERHGDLSKTVADTSSLWLSVKTGIRLVVQIPALVAILLVRVYQILISPLFGRTCRFYPSCSQYYILAVRKYGLIRGSCKGTTRICRCHPWNPGGYDPP